MSKKLTGSALATVVVFIASGALTSVLGTRQYQRLTTDTAWVASTDIGAGQTITQKLIERARVSKDSNYIKNEREIIGTTARAPVKAGKAITPSEIMKPRAAGLSERVPKGKVVYQLKMKGSLLPYSQLRGGDRIDILVSHAGRVRTVAEDVRLIGIMKPKMPAGDSSLNARKQSVSSSASVLLAVSPNQVYPLASVSEKETISMILHSRLRDGDGAQQSIRPNVIHHNIEMLNGLERKTFRFTTAELSTQ